METMFESLDGIMTTNAAIKYDPTRICEIGPPAEQIALFNMLFKDSILLQKRNEFFLLYLDKKIKAGQITDVKKVFENSAVMDLHPSLMKCLLLMTESIKKEDEIEKQRVRLNGVLDSRLMI